MGDESGRGNGNPHTIRKRVFSTCLSRNNSILAFSNEDAQVAASTFFKLSVRFFRLANYP